MQTLLNIVNNPLLEILWIFAEHTDAGGRLFHHLLVTGPNGPDEIALKQANDPVQVSL